MKAVLILALFSVQVIWGQISINDSNQITINVMQDLSSNRIESALDFFETASAENRNAIKKAALRLNSFKSTMTVKIKESNSKDYFINQCIYTDINDTIDLMLTFYYKKSSEKAWIEKMEVKDKIYFETIENKNKSTIGGAPPPEMIIN